MTSSGLSYNLGHEYNQNLQASYECGVVLGNEVAPTLNGVLDQDGGHSLAYEFQQMCIKPNEANNQSARARNKVLFVVIELLLTRLEGTAKSHLVY